MSNQWREDQNRCLREIERCKRPSGIAFKTFAAAPTSATGIDFDHVFADATRQSQCQYVNRARKE
jgi:hypothetical protein